MIYSPIWIIFFPATFILSDFIHIYFHTVFSEKTNTKYILIYIYTYSQLIGYRYSLFNILIVQNSNPSYLTDTITNYNLWTIQYLDNIIFRKFIILHTYIFIIFRRYNLTDIYNLTYIYIYIYIYNLWTI